MQRQIRVFVADDHPIVRKGLHLIVSDARPGIAVVGEASDGPTALSGALCSDCDVVVLDVNLPGMNGLEVLKRIKERRGDLPVVMYSVYPEEQCAVRAFRAGAAGYVFKGDQPDEVVRAIHKVAQGGRYVSPGLAEKLVDALDPAAAQPPHAALTDRELQVVRLLASGRTVTQIGAELFLSVKTVSTYRTRVLEKLRLGSTAELIAYALANGLVDYPFKEAP